MKPYTNPSRKPMMLGGVTRVKRMSGSPKKGEKAPPKGPITVGSMQGATPEEMQMQRREELERLYERSKDNPEDLRRYKMGAEKNTPDGMMMRNIINAGEVDLPPGDQETP